MIAIKCNLSYKTKFYKKQINLYEKIKYNYVN